MAFCIEGKCSKRHITMMAQAGLDQDADTLTDLSDAACLAALYGSAS